MARAKLDAKKKFGSSPSTNHIILSNGQVEKPSPSEEKESYIRRRIKDDFTRLMNRQTKVFAAEVSKLEPFQAGFAQKCFPATDLASESDANLVTAGTLLVNVLPALAEKEVSRTSQLAADALIHALEINSLSPESFFDAIAILAENKDILVGSDRILAQLFSRSSCSGNTKVLRTSSGADSKLFATTNGPFIIYNTIENTETTASPSSRYSNRSFGTTNSSPARPSPRERKARATMPSVSEVSTKPRSRISKSLRTSPPKVVKLTRSSKLRDSVSFAKSPSPPRKRVKLTHEHVSVAHDPGGLEPASKLHLATQKPSINEYQSEQVAPPRTAMGHQSGSQIEIRNDLVKNLLDLALFVSQEDTDYDSELDEQEAGTSNRAAEADSVRFIRHSPRTETQEQHSTDLPPSLMPTKRRHNNTSLLGAPSATSPGNISDFKHIVQKLPTGETNLNHEQIKQAAALYDQLAQGPTFDRAKELGLSYPEIPRPFADTDGWKFTGVVNEFGEEIIEIDRRLWMYPPEGTQDIQQPLRRLKRKAQFEQEHVFGFPPIAGYGNEPQNKRQRSDDEVEENVAYERLMLDVRKAAEVRGLPYNKALSWEQLVDSIKSFDASHGITLEEVSATLEAAAHDDADDNASSLAQASEVSEIDTDDDSDYEPDLISNNRAERAWKDGNITKASTFIAINDRRESLRKLRHRPSSAQRGQYLALDHSPVPGVSHSTPGMVQKLIRNQPNHAEMSPASTTKYDIRPPTTSGTFNTFNGPITSSISPTASPAGTPSFMKFNFNISRKRFSTSPAPSAAIGTRRASNASVSTSSLASRPPSAQPLDMDNTYAYNAAKGYTNNNTTTNSSVHTMDPGSPGGLNGGFPGGGIIINAPDRRGDGRGQRRKSKAPDFKMTVQKAGKEGPKVQARAVRGGTVLKFT